ncbi:unnamed protein product, partial [Thlaspi arvense]
VAQAVERGLNVQILWNILATPISVLVIFSELNKNLDLKMGKTMIQNMIKEGKIVPSEVTIKLLQRAMQESGNDKFLIDGFPRNEENRAAFESVTGIEPEYVLFFDCPEEEMERDGREDDNIETIRKRFKVYMESSLPVIEYYNSKGRLERLMQPSPLKRSLKLCENSFQPIT